MTLNELLKIVNSNVRIQVQIEMYGYTFKANGYRESFLSNEEKAELLDKEVKTVWITADEGISALAVALG